MSIRLLSILFSLVLLVPASDSRAEEQQPIPVGVVLALTGDLAQSGVDMQHAFAIMDEMIGKGRYKLLVQDDRCNNVDALNIAKKFIEIDKVKHVIGFTCNQTLMSTAPVYEKAGVLVLSSGGTSGDVADIGKHNFRFFPSDMFGAVRLFEYVKPKHRSMTILTEQTEYATMMERSFLKLNKDSGSPMALRTFQFKSGDKDLKSLLLRIKSLGDETLYINADSDTSFITILKQLDTVKYEKPRYAVYLPASASVLAEIPKLNEGIVFSNLPKIDVMLSDSGRPMLAEFRKRYGEPLSGFPTAMPSMEVFRVLDLAIKSGRDPAEFIRGKSFADGFLPPYSFDQTGNIQGLRFEMQKIVDGKVILLEQ